MCVCEHGLCRLLLIVSDAGPWTCTHVCACVWTVFFLYLVGLKVTAVNELCHWTVAASG